MRRIRELTIGEERGAVFVAGLVLVAIMTLLGIALFNLAAIEASLSTGDASSNQLLYCTEAALGRTMLDASRMAQITAALGTTNQVPFSETVTTNTVTCANDIMFTDDTANARRYLRATSSAPNGTRRSVRIQLNFLPTFFQYASVANSGNFVIGGAGSIPPSGPGGADAINGDIFVSGTTSRIYVGSPSAPTFSGAASTACATGTLCSSTAVVRPRSTTDSTPTVSVQTGNTTWSQNLADHSTAPWPVAGDSSAFGTQASIPQPDVVSYVNSVKAAVGLTSTSTGNLTGTFQGSPVYNLSAIFAAFGANSSGSTEDTNGALMAPSGCTTCSGSPTGNCGIYCQLQPLGIKLNPGLTRASVTGSTTQNDYFIDGVFKNTDQFTSAQTGCQGSCTGANGAQSLLDLSAANSQPPILVADGNVWFNYDGSRGFAVNGRATFVSTYDVYMGDNLIYKDGLGPSGGCPTGSTNAGCVPATADMLSLVASRDVWYGDPLNGAFAEASAIMLAGRDFNFVFNNASGTPVTPAGPIILNGTVMANRAVNIFRDFANPSGSSSSAACNAGSTGCLPIAFDPSCGGAACSATAPISPTQCKSTAGCWRFVVRNSSTGLVSFDTTRNAFKECGTGSCPSGSRRITHYQMTLNYDNRLYTPGLAPPGLFIPNFNNAAGFYGANFAKQWQDWQQCTITTGPATSC